MSQESRGYAHLPSQADLFYFCTTLDSSEDDLNIHYAPPSRASLKVGILLLGTEEVHLLDLAPVDMLAMIGRTRMSRLDAPDHVLDVAVDELDVRYVNETGEGLIPVTSGVRVPVMNSFQDAPQFDILLIPGFFTSAELSASAVDFVQAQASDPSLVAIFSISSGVFPLAQTGFLSEKRATAPAFLLPTLRQRYPKTLWQSTRWTRQDNLWSSNSAITAVDMVSAWMREYFWDRAEAVEWVMGAVGITPLEEYE